MSERTLKIGQYLAKIWTIHCSWVSCFFGHSVYQCWLISYFWEVLESTLYTPRAPPVTQPKAPWHGRNIKQTSLSKLHIRLLTVCETHEYNWVNNLPRSWTACSNRFWLIASCTAFVYNTPKIIKLSTLQQFHAANWKTVFMPHLLET